MALTINKDLIISNSNTKLENLVPHLITVALNGNQVVSGTNVLTKIELNYEKDKVGDKLSFNNNSVVIGQGISYVKVSANVIINAFVGNGLRRILVYKNNKEYARSMAYYDQNFNNSIIITPIIIPVQQGDTISIYTNNTGTSTTIYGRVQDTYMTVEIIK